MQIICLVCCYIGNWTGDRPSPHGTHWFISWPDQAWICNKYTAWVFCLGSLIVSESLSHMFSVQPGVWDAPGLGETPGSGQQPPGSPWARWWRAMSLPEPVGTITGQPVSKQIMACMCVPLVCGCFSATGLISLPAVQCADCNCQRDNWIFFCCLNQKEVQSKLESNSLPSQHFPRKIHRNKGPDLVKGEAQWFNSYF